MTLSCDHVKKEKEKHTMNRKLFFMEAFVLFTKVKGRSLTQYKHLHLVASKAILYLIQKITMKNILLLLASLPFLFSCNDSKNNSSTIKVSGEGKIRVKPNLVILTIDVSFVQPRMADAVRLSQQTVDSVVDILATFGNKQDDIKTSSISANKEYNYDNRGVSHFAGYKAEQSIDFVLNDLTKFTDVTARLLATRINSISQVQFGHSKADSLLREADLLAYDDALKSANKLCDRANIKLGKLLYLTNTEGGSEPGMYSNMGSINTFNKSYGGEGFKISPEVLVFRRSVVSEYEVSK